MTRHTRQTPDFAIEDHGSIVLLRPMTTAAEEWIEEHIGADAQTWAGATVVEPRYIADIAEGIQADGLTVR